VVNKQDPLPLSGSARQLGGATDDPIGKQVEAQSSLVTVSLSATSFSALQNAQHIGTYDVLCSIDDTYHLCAQQPKATSHLRITDCPHVTTMRDVSTQAAQPIRGRGTACDRRTMIPGMLGLTIGGLTATSAAVQPLITVRALSAQDGIDEGDRRQRHFHSSELARGGLIGGEDTTGTRLRGRQMGSTSRKWRCIAVT